MGVPSGRRSRIGMVLDRTEINSAVMLGKPVIRGTRILVEAMLRKLGEGVSEAELLDAYPRLKPEDIKAAIWYATDVLGHEEILDEPPKAAVAGG
jgi:uncharacterized protein (DUF433 family)